MKPRFSTVLPFLLGSLIQIPTTQAAPVIQATLEDSLPTDGAPAGTANDGDVIEYRAVISNTGDQTATGVSFDAPLDPKTHQLNGQENISPLALNDSYQAIGNTPLKVGVAAGTGPERVVAGSAFDNDREFLGDTFSFDQVTVSPANGQVVFNANGSFTYTPNAGFEGNDSFVYQIKDAKGLTGTGTVTIAVDTPVWYVNPAAASDGTGTAISPLKTLTKLNDGSAPDEAGDVIYLYEGTHTGGLTLLNDQRLIGAGSVLQVNGTTLISAGTRPTLSHTAVALTLGQNNTVSGLDITSTNNHAVNGASVGLLAMNVGALTSTNGSALRVSSGTGATNITVGTITVNSVNAGGTGVFLSGIPGSFTVSGATNITCANGGGISIASSAAAVNFAAVTVNGRLNTGISLNGSTGVTNFGAVSMPSLSGSAAGHGIRIEGGNAAVTFASTTIAGTRQTVATSDPGGDAIPDNDGDGDAIFIKNQTAGVTINGGTLSNLACDGIDIRNSASLTLTNMTIQDIGLASSNTVSTDSAGIFVRDLSGTLSVKDTIIRRFHGAVDAGNDSTGHQERGINFRNNGVSFSQLRLDNVDMENTAAHGLEGADGVEAVFTGAVSGAIKIFNGCSFRNLSDGEGVQIVHSGSGTLNVEVANSSFADAVQWDHDANSATAKLGGFGGIDFSADGSATCNVNIRNNTFHDLYMGNFTAGNVNLRARGSSACSFLFTGNTMDGDALDNQAGRIGVNITAGDAGGINGGDPAPTKFDVLIENNTIDETDDDAFTVEVRGRALSNGTPANIVVRNNMIGQTDAVSRRNGFEGARIRLRDAVPKTANVLVSNNNIRSHGNSNGDGVVEITSEAAGCVMNATVNGNTFKNDDAAVGAPVFYADSRIGGVMNLDLSGNTADSGTNIGPIEYLINNGGQVNVKGPGAGAVSATNIQSANLSGGGLAQIGAGTTVFNNNASIPAAVPPTAPSLPLMLDPEFLPLPAPAEIAEPAIEEGETTAPAGRVTTNLTQDELDVITTAARERWMATGLNPAQQELLSAVRVTVADLHGLHLGASRPGFIELDSDAATTGWFIDETPASDEEFAGEGRLKAGPGSLGQNRMDLLTTVMHELGHQFGLGDIYESSAREKLMYGYLIPGERRLPHSGEANGAIPTGKSHDEYLTSALVIGDLPAGKSVTLTFQAEVDLAVGTSISVQGTVSGSNFANVVTNDPATGAANDATVTPYQGNLPPVVAANTAAVSGFVSDELTNTGTWSDPDTAQTVSLSASIGTITQNVNGTWSWSYTPVAETASPVTVTISANDGTSLSNSVTQTSFTYSAARKTQAITFSLPSTISHTGTIPLSATGGASGEAVTFSLQSGPGQISAGTLSFSGTGDVTVNANQAGNATYLPAPTVQSTVNVTNAAPVLAVNGAPLTVTIEQTQTANATGTFSDADNEAVTLTATSGGNPFGSVSGTAGAWTWNYPNAAPGNYTVRITGTDTLGETGFTEFTVNVSANAYLAWLSSYGMTGEDLGQDDDYDGDGVVNLLEFAFGTDPTVSSPQVLDAPVVAGNRTLNQRGRPFHEITNTNGAPSMQALFMRRVSYATDGLSYHVEFSADLTTWQTSAATPQVLLAGGAYELVGVPYPFFLSDGRKARFFRVRVEFAP
ncbi:cadherin-like domain-containing protein [Luteolibacter sp. GHJ8]|uniref:Cadherin-like domain-containing protein n=1 Tax=Luteolibacter rhizosphaerae TaxID=2989719 RepID=A0ABT3G5R0_9BACT|nr:cadherin-like domain-containing protein [Luteolibacter rhizosphaerae]MCW1914904.1 cadherin-like domain-containing protein [Luteolibacter rhizosphaerae]